uniref:Putative ovule protein n=1 Tax=Solanum chacoense TaxID=4108 RepID=A0A0V0GXC7_SOLCH
METHHPPPSLGPPLQRRLTVGLFHFAPLVTQTLNLLKGPCQQGIPPLSNFLQNSHHRIHIKFVTNKTCQIHTKTSITIYCRSFFFGCCKSFF